MPRASGTRAVLTFGETTASQHCQAASHKGLIQRTPGIVVASVPVDPRSSMRVLPRKQHLLVGNIC